MERGVLVERAMGPQRIVVGSILRQHTGSLRFTIAPPEYTGTHDPCMLPDSAVADILFRR
jgi:hypothetical protein